MNAAGGAESLVAGRTTESPAKIERLMEDVCERENLKKTLRRVKSNRGSAAIDGITVKQLPAYLRERRPALRDQLLSGTCKPQPVRRVGIPKSGGGVRKLDSWVRRRLRCVAWK